MSVNIFFKKSLINSFISIIDTKVSLIQQREIKIETTIY